MCVCVHNSESVGGSGWRGEGVSWVMVMNSVAGCGGRAVGNEGVDWCKQRADL